MQTLVGNMLWFALESEATLIAVAPFFHVTGMQGGMNGPLYNGNSVVLLPRWDREVAAQCVERYKAVGWTGVPTMIQDFFSNPDIDRYDLSSIRRLSGGGAAMPAAVAQRLEDRGIRYFEGYGMTETMGAVHINPPHRTKPQCLGIPMYDVDSRIIDPETLREVPQGEVGEIVTRAPQVFLGYWNKPEDTKDAFIELQGQRFLRTGDLGRVDEDGYFFMVDRLKRMINASGYKVWPSEVESFMYRHPAVLEACVIGARDEHRGEDREGARGSAPGMARTHRRASTEGLVSRQHGGLQGASHHRAHGCTAQVGCGQDSLARPSGTGKRGQRPDLSPRHRTTDPVQSLDALFLLGGGVVLEVVGFQSVASEQLVEISAVAFGQAGRLTDVAGGGLEVLREIVAREGVARLVVGGHFRRILAQGAFDEFAAHDFAVRQRDILFHQLEQLPHIAGPIRGREQLDGAGRIDLLPAAFFGHLFEKVGNQQWNVLATPAQGRDLDGQDIDVIVQILAEFAVLHHLLQIDRGRADEANLAVRRPLPMAGLAPRSQGGHEFDLQPRR